METYEQYVIDINLVQIQGNDYSINSFRVNAVEAYDNRYSIYVDTYRLYQVLDCIYTKNKGSFDIYTILKMQNKKQIRIIFIKIVQIDENKLICSTVNVPSDKALNIINTIYPTIQ